MTLPKPNAWAICACGRKMRRSNPSGVCGRCNQKVLNKEACRRYYHAKVDDVRTPLPETLHPKQIAAARQLAAVALESAQAAGHDIECMLQDTEPGGWIGECRTCERFLVIDPAESAFAYGRVAQGMCDGPPQSGAPRRLASSYHQATSSAANESADREPPRLAASWGDEERERWA